MNTFFYGFSVSLSLIFAIGAQNAFVLKQGLMGKHVLLVCAICALSDAALILVGVSGFHFLVQEYPQVEATARYGGALFLMIYGGLSFRSACRANQHLPDSTSISSWSKTALTCLAFTWLNPHVYIDTVILIGAISTHFSAQITHFTLGAISASLTFFLLLGYGSSLLRPLFEKPRSWQILEFLIGITMWTIAIRLLLF